MTEYKIGKLTWTQSELTWGQDKKLMKKVAKLAKVLDGNEEIKFSELKKFLFKHDLMDVFWGLVLRPKYTLVYFIWRLITILLFMVTLGFYSFKHTNIDLADGTTLDNMFDDFFLSNQKFMTKLSLYAGPLGLIAQTAMADLGTKPKATESSEKI